MRTTLVRAFGQAQRWGLLSRNPAALVDPPHVPETEIVPLSLDEARALLDAVAGHRLESLYTVAIAHGIRMSEAIGAQWSYVDLTAGTFEVWPTLTRTMEGEVVEGGTKNRRRRRFVLTPTAVEQLRVHKSRLAEERRTLGESWTVNDLVWPSRVGTPSVTGRSCAICTVPAHAPGSGGCRSTRYATRLRRCCSRSASTPEW